MTDPAGAGIYANMNGVWIGYMDGIHVTIYSSTMDPMGNGFKLFKPFGAAFRWWVEATYSSQLNWETHTKMA